MRLNYARIIFSKNYYGFENSVDGEVNMSRAKMIDKLEKKVADDLQIPVERIRGAVDLCGDTVTITFVLPKSVVEELEDLGGR